jgi:protein TonB
VVKFSRPTAFDHEGPVFEPTEVASRLPELAATIPPLERSEEPSEPEPAEASLPTSALARSEVASTAEVAVETIELPPVEANGRGESGSGSGNTVGDGNGGARGRAGGSFESYARNGPWNPAPVYPVAAQAARMEGVVKVRVLVGIDGKVIQASLERSSGWPLLDEAAMQVLPTWRFEPARRGGVPAECEIIVPIDFYMRRS